MIFILHNKLFEIHFFQRPAPYINYLTDRHPRSTSWSMVLLFTSRLWYCYSLIYRSCRSEVFLGKGILKICCKFTKERSCRNAISIKFLCNFIEITLWHGCSPVNLLHIFRTTFSRNTSGWLLLDILTATLTLTEKLVIKIKNLLKTLTL